MRVPSWWRVDGRVGCQLPQLLCALGVVRQLDLRGNWMGVRAAAAPGGLLPV